ncbi:MAG: hypothetical protein AB1546_05170 [bacterium]
MYKTVTGILTPDGKLSLENDSIPEFPVEVMVTFVKPFSEPDLSDIGDYNEKLISYEEKLAKGEIRWK